jgi:hypothetical protein
MGLSWTIAKYPGSADDKMGHACFPPGQVHYFTGETFYSRGLTFTR